MKFNKKKFTILVVLLILILVLAYIYNNTQKINNEIISCNINMKEKLEKFDEHDAVNNIRRHEKIISGFYTTKEKADIQGAAKRIVDKFGWKDFIMGFEPPTALIFSNGEKFNYGDLIEIQVNDYETVNTGEPNAWRYATRINVGSAKKLDLPTDQDIVNNAQQFFELNKKDIFKCVGTKSSKFSSFIKANNHVKWNNINNEYYLYYVTSRSLESDSRGEFQKVDVHFFFNKDGEVIDVNINSSFGYLGP